MVNRTEVHEQEVADEVAKRMQRRAGQLAGRYSALISYLETIVEESKRLIVNLRRLDEMHDPKYGGCIALLDYEHLRHIVDERIGLELQGAAKCIAEMEEDGK